MIGLVAGGSGLHQGGNRGLHNTGGARAGGLKKFKPLHPRPGGGADACIQPVSTMTTETK